MRGGGSQSATNFVMRLRRSKQASDRSQPALLLSPLTASHRVPPLLSCHRDSKTRHCEGCDADFRPARPWSRFCGPARRLSAPIAALFTLGKILDRILSSMRPRARARAIPDGKCAVEWKLFRFGPGSATSLSRSPKVELIAGALPQ